MPFWLAFGCLTRNVAYHAFGIPYLALQLRS